MSGSRSPPAIDCQAPKKTLNLRSSVPSLLQSHTLLSQRCNLNCGIRAENHPIEGLKHRAHQPSVLVNLSFEEKSIRLEAGRWGFKQTELVRPGAAEVLRGQLGPATVDPGLLARQLEQLRHLLREDTFAAHPGAEMGIVQLTAAHSAYAV